LIGDTSAVTPNRVKLNRYRGQKGNLRHTEMLVFITRVTLC